MFHTISIAVFSQGDFFTLKHQEMHCCIVSTVATDALVLKHQATSIHSADKTFIVLDQFHIKIYTYDEQH